MEKIKRSCKVEAIDRINDIEDDLRSIINLLNLLTVSLKNMMIYRDDTNLNKVGVVVGGEGGFYTINDSLIEIVDIISTRVINDKQNLKKITDILKEEKK